MAPMKRRQGGELTMFSRPYACRRIPIVAHGLFSAWVPVCFCTETSVVWGEQLQAEYGLTHKHTASSWDANRLLLAGSLSAAVPASASASKHAGAA